MAVLYHYRHVARHFVLYFIDENLIGVRVAEYLAGHIHTGEAPCRNDDFGHSRTAVLQPLDKNFAQLFHFCTIGPHFY